MKYPVKPWRSARKWDCPISFSPHKEKFINRDLYTLIIIDRDCEVGDSISLFLDSKKPYNYNNRTEYFEITHVFNITLYPDKFSVSSGSFRDYLGYFWRECDGLAKIMGVEPPSGIEMGRLLNERHNIPKKGVKAQIIKWKPDKEKESTGEKQ